MYNDYPIIYESNINQMLIYYIIASIIILAVIIFTYFSLAKIYKKANRSGISAIIPFYNTLVLLEIVNLPKWYFILLLIPGVNIIFYIKVMITLSKLFRKGKGFALGMVFLPFIFYPILAFNDSEYIGINLVAMEGKSTVVELPRIVTEEEKPIVNEEVDEKSKNINISIGGGVYQKDYSNTLLNVDQNQTIVNKTVNNTENRPTNVILPKIEEPIKKEETNVITNNQPLDIQNDLNSIQPQPIKENVSEIITSSQNNQQTFITCPKCGATIKSGNTTCFLCGTKLD